MRTVIIDCDRCKARISEGRSVIRLEGDSGELRDMRIDLCASCSEALREWLSVNTESIGANNHA